MKRVKLFPKIFLYTFLVMMFVTVLAHVPLYIFCATNDIKHKQLLREWGNHRK